MKHRNYSHSLDGAFKESRNPVKSPIHIMEEVMKTRKGSFSENVLTAEYNLSL